MSKDRHKASADEHYFSTPAISLTKVNFGLLNKEGE